MAGAYLAIGSCISALTKNQVIAFIVAGDGLLPAGHERAGTGARICSAAGRLPFLVSAIASLSFLGNFESITKGIVDPARHRLLPVADRVRLVCQQDHHRSAQSRLKVRFHGSNDATKHAALTTVPLPDRSWYRSTAKLAWGGLALAAIILLAVNLFASSRSAMSGST